jgi:hypothetical protein
MFGTVELLVIATMNFFAPPFRPLNDGCPPKQQTSADVSPPLPLHDDHGILVAAPPHGGSEAHSVAAIVPGRLQQN